ncbi:Na+/H+ antiporter subunit G [Pelagibius litoralis]|uniref:Na+/H+ antiporter subunit G n=1 Tax=Pelagibius litoralis TaxID=374515 RepID=A0A967C2K2_9PROT|nr:Na+/H+ antiporter subunit G [Pelagibius litoralis]NIA67135.1 Na+/H+ antiporter subunit G [Pelagibius litoralis]
MDFLAELLIAALIVFGGVFGLVGSYGLAKLPDLMTRLHGPTKATTLGVGSVLMASMVFILWDKGTLSVHELLVTIFLLLTAPITANFIAKSFLHRQANPETDLPPTGTECGWASFDVPPDSDDDEPNSLTIPRRNKG